jgi:hypothetical protein
MVNKINKINSVTELVTSNKRYKVGVVLFFVGLAMLVIATLVLALLYPHIFGL